MFTIKKIWNALNHAGKPWQISLAISLGMIVGLTPFISLHNVVIIIAALLLNIHVGVFILSISLFGALGLILDPFFASVGITVLNAESLQMIFTQMYNNPLGNLSGFNNTILMGSLLISFILFPFMSILTSILLIKYRTIIATKIQNIPLLNKLQFFKNEEIKEIKTFRLAGVLVLVFIVASLTIFKIFIFDMIVKSNLEKAISKASHKTVTIESLSTSIFNSSMELDNILVLDVKDASNSIEIKNIVLDINFSELIFKKFIVDNIIIDQISFPTTNIITSKKKSTTETTTATKVKPSEKNSLDRFTSLKNIDINSIQNEFDKDYKAEFDKYKNYYSKIKPLFNSEKKTEEKRADGLFVYFDLDSSLPEFLIKKGTFAVLKNGTIISGIFYDFTNNQYLYKKPFRLSVETSTKSFKSLNVKLSILEIKEKSLDTLTARVKEYAVQPINKNGTTLTNTIINTNIDIKISNKNNIEGNETIDVLSSDIAFPEANKYIAILNKSLIKTKGIKGNVALSGTLDAPKVTIASNLDSILKKKVKTVLSSQKENIKNEVKEKVKSKLKDKLKGILGF